MAYELQAAKTRQKIRNEEIAIEVVERRKQIEVSRTCRQFMCSVECKIVIQQFYIYRLIFQQWMSLYGITICLCH